MRQPCCSTCAPIEAASRLVGGTNGCWLQRAHQFQGLDAGQVDVHVVAGGNEVQAHALCRNVSVLLCLQMPACRTRKLGCSPFPVCWQSVDSGSHVRKLQPAQDGRLANHYAAWWGLKRLAQDVCSSNAIGLVLAPEQCPSGAQGKVIGAVQCSTVHLLRAVGRAMLGHQHRSLRSSASK